MLYRRHESNVSEGGFKKVNSFFEMVRSGYLEMAKSNEKRFVLLDGSQSADAIEDEIWEHLNKRYGIGN